MNVIESNCKSKPLSILNKIIYLLCLLFVLMNFTLMLSNEFSAKNESNLI